MPRTDWTYRPVSIVGIAVLLLLGAIAAPAAQAGELWIGAASVDITPDKPAPLLGQFHVRIGKIADNPLTATAVAIETRQAGRPADQAILVSCDLCLITPELQDQLRTRLRGVLPDFDVRKLILTATHTHTAPCLKAFWYEIPKDVMQPEQYVQFLVERLGRMAEKAWKGRQPGGVSWALGHAVVGHNRRSVYADGKSLMYGPVTRPDFRNFESGEDHGLELLFFWDRQKRPIAVAINTACPSQEVESRTTINADFWHDVRQQLTARHKGLCVLGWPGAGGDQSPHVRYRTAAEERMRKLRGLSPTEEIARRIVREVEDVFELAKQDIRADAPLIHRVQEVALPKRKITEEEMKTARAKVEEIDKKQSLGPGDHAHRVWHQEVIDRYNRQTQEPQKTIEVHAIRVGDVAITTNPFELFLDYGLRIKARSKALQTFVLQLTTPWSGYLPTAKAVAGGGYSAVIESGVIGPEGGQVLVDRTVEMVNSMFAGAKGP